MGITVTRTTVFLIAITYAKEATAQMTRLFYKPLSTLTSVLGGVIASLVFKRVWKLITHQDNAPTATHKGRTWKEILAAAALQGAIFGLVKAAVDRGGAVGFERATGAWPGDKEPSPANA
jgi:Protein of unknown function (DUF4235)